MKAQVKFNTVMTLALLPLAVLAADSYTFPTPNGDLASNGDDGWKGGKPTATDAIVIIDQSGDYTVSSDVAFGTVKADVDGVKIANAGTITLNPSAGQMFNGPNVQNATTTLKGGTWKSTAGAKWWVAGIGWDGDATVGNGYTLVLDGAVVSTSGSFLQAKQRSDITLMLMNGASLAVASASGSDVCFVKDSGARCKLDVGAGCTVTAKQQIYSDKVSSAGSRTDVLIDIHGSGAVFNGGFYLTSGFKGTHNCWRVRDGGKLLAANGTFHLGSNAASTDNRLEVLESAEAQLSGVQYNTARDTVVVSNGTLDVVSFSVASAASSATLLLQDGATLSVSGSGDAFALGGTAGSVTANGAQTKLTVQNNLAVNGDGNAIALADGAAVAATKVTFGGKRNRAEFTAAELNVQNGFNFGSSSMTTADGGSLTLKQGSTATIGWVYPFSADNVVLVDNSTLTLSSEFTFGTYATVTNNSFTVRGAGTAMPRIAADPFGDGPSGNRLVLADHVAWKIGACHFAATSSNNLLKVTGGSVVDASTDDGRGQQCYIGEKANEKCRNNIVEISDGSRLIADRFFLTGSGNQLVVDNGTVDIKSGTDTTYGLWLSYNAGGHTGDASTDNWLVIRGSNSVVTCGTPAARAMCLGGDATATSGLRYEIPVEGYTAGHAPLKAYSLNITLGSRLEVDCAAWAADALAKGISKKAVLFQSASKIGSEVADWVRAQPLGLPENVKLIVTDNEIILKASSGKGLVISVR